MIATPIPAPMSAPTTKPGVPANGRTTRPNEAPTATAANQPKPLGVSSSR